MSAGAERPGGPGLPAPAPAESAERALADQAARITAARLASSSIDLITAIVLVAIAPRELVAVLSFGLIAYETAKHLAVLGFADSVLVFFERLGPAGHRAFARQTTKILGLTGLVAAGAVCGLSALAPVVLTSWSPPAVAQVQALLPLLALVVALEVPTWPLPNVMLAAGRVRDAAWFQLGSSLAMFGALFGPLLAGGGAWHAGLGLFGYAVARFAVAGAWLRVALPGPGAPLGRALLREQLAFSLPLGLNALVVRLNKSIDRFVVAALLPAGALADYQVGAQELPLITVIPFAVGSVLVGRYVSLRAAGRQAELLALWRRAIEKVALLVLPATAWAIALAPELIALLFPAEYGAAVWVFRIYALLLIQRVAQYGVLLQAHQDTATILRLTLAMLACNAALSVPMTWAFGLAGTAGSTVLAGLAGWWLYQRRIAGLLGCRVGEVVPWARYLTILAIAGLSAGLVVAGRAMLPNLSAGLSLAFGTAVFVLVTGGLLRATGTLTRADLAALARWCDPRFHLRA